MQCDKQQILLTFITVEISLKDFASAGEWLVLVFIPMAWSFVCPTEIRAFDRRIQEFDTRTAAVAFCSTDSEFVLRAWNHTSELEGGLGGVRVPLISDRSHQIARDFGVLIENEGVAHRATFIIDPQSTIRQITLNDANVGRSIDEVRRLLDALSFADEFGEGCPVDWKKGDAGVKVRHSSEPTPKRPSALKRQSTWSSVSGWLGKNGTSSPTHAPSPSQQIHQPQQAQQVYSPTPQSPISPRPQSFSTEHPTVVNWGASQNNSRFRLEPIPQAEQEAANDMYFASPSSPLTTPKSVFNMMHNHSEKDLMQKQTEPVLLWAKP
ncbi:MAG: cTPxI [Chrysothrix sp. TS-e1954]|nr:MAG: cTPxI [Chrysothrix sp. TS-e1954]